MIGSHVLIVLFHMRDYCLVRCTRHVDFYGEPQQIQQMIQLLRATQFLGEPQQIKQMFELLRATQ